jgi:hypothetical protein
VNTALQPPAQVVPQTVLQSVLAATQVGLSTMLLARPIPVRALMGQRQQEQLALPTMPLFVQAAIRVTLLTVPSARPTRPMFVLVQMGLRPPEQTALPTMLRFVQVATQVGL